MQLAQSVSPYLPCLRRYARALTGSQRAGDAHVRLTLESLLERPEILLHDVNPRAGLYRVFHQVWTVTHPSAPTHPEASMQGRKRLIDRLDNLSLARREALLLTTVEGFSPAEAGRILDRSAREIPALVRSAVEDLAAQIPTAVLIIEDEAATSLELAEIVEEMGHSVSAVATSESKAIRAADDRPPGLILSDLRLDQNGSGVSAVSEILDKIDAPVIYITGYPERLHAQSGPQPEFLVHKPFARASVKAAICQALLQRAG
jgi:DNA-directed RNA polymerase specialized sigma24 family protein